MNRQERRRQKASARRAGAPSPAGPGGGPASLHELLTRAVAAHQAGRLDEAERLYGRILAAAPDQPETLHALGLLHQHRGRGPQAVALLKRALALRPRSAQFLNDLGSVQLDLGEVGLEEAAARFAEAVAIDPRFAAAHYNLGLVHLKRGEPERAVGCFETAVKLAPNYAMAQLMLGNALDNAGRKEEAIARYRKLVALAPSFPQGWHSLGVCLRAMGEFEEAARAFERAIALDPSAAAVHNDSGLALFKLWRLPEAEAAFGRALALAPDFAEAHNNLGIALYEDGRFDEAAAHFRRALALRSDFVEPMANLGMIALGRGQFDDAKTWFEAGLAIRPDDATAIHGLLSASPSHATEETAARIETMLAARDLSAEQRSALRFALGRIFDSLGDFARAFANFERGHALSGGAGAFDGGSWRRQIDAVIGVFDREFFAVRRGWGNPSEAPVFIVGMPRSGTTLVEQILSAHPAVAAAGELPHIARMVETLAKEFGLPALDPRAACMLAPEAMRASAQRYLALLAEGRQGFARVTDKLPGNFLYLGFIALLFPKARLIHCRRDPLDTCLSCYATAFGRPESYMHDLGNLGLYYRQYERLMAHWRAVLPVPMLEVRYEDLVERQEEESRRIVALCGLEWDACCLDFHKSARSAVTASRAQVRQPVYKSAVGRWRNYAAFLGPLRAALGQQ